LLNESFDTQTIGRFTVGRAYWGSASPQQQQEFLSLYETQVVNAYAKRFQADPTNWHFLTGSRADLRKLSWDTFHLSDIGGALEHSTRFVLIDRKGQIRGYYETSDTESIAKLLDDIQTVTKETT